MHQNDKQTTEYNTAKALGNGRMVVSSSAVALDVAGPVAGILVLSGDCTVNSSTATSEDSIAQNVGGVVFPIGQWVFSAKDVNVTTTGTTLLVLG